MAWYDLFSNVYDRSLEDLYRPYRQQALDTLDLQNNDVIFDIACGTAQNLSLICTRLTEAQGIYVGLDLSPGMLRRARSRAQSLGLDDEAVILLDRSVQQVQSQDLLQACGKAQADVLVFALGLTVLGDWREVFRQGWAHLRPGGQALIFDVHAETRAVQTWLVERIARADLSRTVWTELQAQAQGFSLTWTKAPENKMGGRLFYATGTKPGLPGQDP